MQISFHSKYLKSLKYGVHPPSPAWNLRISSNGEGPESAFEQQLYTFTEYTLDGNKNLVKYIFSLQFTGIKLNLHIILDAVFRQGMLEFSRQIWYSTRGSHRDSQPGAPGALRRAIRKEARRSSRAEIYNIIREIPGEIDFQSFLKWFA